VVLSADEVVRFLESVSSLKARVALTTAYAAGLRVSEVAALKARDIDNQRMVMRIEHGKGVSGRRPVVKGLVVALGTLRVRSCLRPVGAGNESPAGPDAGPHGSSPNQQNALVMAPALFPGLPSRSVGSHRFAVALDADRLTAKPRSC
jgi:integrase